MMNNERHQSTSDAKSVSKSFASQDNQFKAQRKNVLSDKVERQAGSKQTNDVKGSSSIGYISSMVPASPVRQRTKSASDDKKIMRTPSPPILHLPTIDSLKHTTLVINEMNRPLSTQAGQSTNRTGSVDLMGMTHHMSNNGPNTGKYAGSTVKKPNITRTNLITSNFALKTVQATPSMHVKSTHSLPTNSVQKSVLIPSSRFPLTSSDSPPSDIPLCRIFPRELVDKMKELQSCKTADEVEDEEEDDFAIGCNYPIMEEDEEDNDNVSMSDNDVASECEKAIQRPSKHPLLHKKDSSQMVTLKNKFGFNAIQKGAEEKNKPKTVKEINANKALPVSNCNNHQALVDKYRKMIIKKESSNKEQLKEKEPLRHSKSEPDLCSMDLSTATGDTSPSLRREYQDSIRMYHKHALKRSESQDDFHASKLKSIWVKGKEYIVLNLLGQGGSSQVYQVYDAQSQQVYAIKVVDLRKVDANIRSSLRKEIELLSRLKHCKRVVRLIEYEFDEKSNRLMLVMEKGDSDLGSILKQFLETDSSTLDSVVIKFYWKEMLKAVDEIHANGVVHSDLKPVNFISVRGKLKLIDFGIADAVETNHTSVLKDAQIGTVNFMPPEALIASHSVPAATGNSSGASGNGQSKSGKNVKNIFKLSYKSDIWSLGCILYNLVYQRPPFAHLTNVYAKIQAICDPKHVIQFPPTRHTLVVDCLKRCLQRKPHDRPSARELLQHPFLNDEKKLTSLVSKPVYENRSMNKIINQMAALTPNRLNQLEKITSQLASKK